jgi:alpha-N-arabinofuranosidase
MASIKFSHQMRLELTHREGHRYAILHVVAGKPADPVAELELEGEGPVYFALQARDWDYQFLAGTSENDLRAVGGVQDARILSSEIAEGFTGSYVGLYASSQGVESSAYADYDWFEYKPVEQDQ